MAKETANLGLYQYEQSDGNQTFNIDTALNDNWQKIDDAIGDASGARSELATHKLDYTAHGIGDKTTLKTSEKTTIVGAVNELFTDVDSGKSQIANAIVGKNGTASSSDTFTQLASAISSISTGKKWAGGTANTNASNNTATVSNLSFTPKIVVIKGSGTESQHIRIYASSQIFGVEINFGNTATIGDVWTNTITVATNSFAVSRMPVNMQWIAFE